MTRRRIQRRRGKLIKSYNERVRARGGKTTKVMLSVDRLDYTKGFLIGSKCFVDFLKNINRSAKSCLDDDYAEESMFEVAPSDALTVKVGEGQTAANQCVSSVAQIISLRESFAG